MKFLRDQPVLRYSTHGPQKTHDGTNLIAKCQIEFVQAQLIEVLLINRSL